MLFHIPPYFARDFGVQQFEPDVYSRFLHTLDGFHRVLEDDICDLIAGRLRSFKSLGNVPQGNQPIDYLLQRWLAYRRLLLF